MISSKHQIKQLYNCKILREEKILSEDLWVRNGKIVDPKTIFYEEKVKPDITIDCNGFLISPGFIDIQINGNQYLNSFQQYYCL